MTRKPEGEKARALAALGAEVVIMLEWLDRVGYSADITANAKEFGIPTTTLEDWAARQKWN